MKTLFLTTLIGVTLKCMVAYAGVYQAVQKDIDEFQGYFHKRFPSLPLAAYSDGVNALPQSISHRTHWEAQLQNPPYSQDMETARALWAKPFANGNTFDRCFKTKPAATKYPYYDKKKNDLITIEMDINECLVENDEPSVINKTSNVALLVAAYKEQFNSQKIAPDVDSAQALILYQKGRQFYWAKRGQLNYSCANCHVHNAGNKHRNEVLPATLGQTSSYPVFSTTWQDDSGKPWGTVHRRYTECMQRTQAAPFAPQSLEYRVLQFYTAVMSTGIPLNIPGLR